MAAAGISQISHIAIINARIAAALAGLDEKNHPVKRGAEGGDLNYFAAKKAKNYSSDRPNLKELENTIKVMEDWLGGDEVRQLKETMNDYRRYKCDPGNNRLNLIGTLHRIRGQLDMLNQWGFPRDALYAYLEVLGHNVEVGTRRLPPYLDELTEEIQSHSVQGLREHAAARGPAPRPPEESKEDDDGDVKIRT